MSYSQIKSMQNKMYIQNKIWWKSSLKHSFYAFTNPRVMKGIFAILFCQPGF